MFERGNINKTKCLLQLREVVCSSDSLLEFISNAVMSSFPFPFPKNCHKGHQLSVVVIWFFMFLSCWQTRINHYAKHGHSVFWRAYFTLLLCRGLLLPCVKTQEIKQYPNPFKPKDIEINFGFTFSFRKIN